MTGHYDMANTELSKKWKRGGKEPDADEAFVQSVYCNCMSCVCQWSNVGKQVRGVSYKNRIITISKQYMIDCIDGNTDL
jgi:hypothetical protein